MNLDDNLGRRNIYVCAQCALVTSSTSTAAEHRLATGGHVLDREVLHLRTRGRGRRADRQWSTPWRRDPVI